MLSTDDRVRVVAVWLSTRVLVLASAVAGGWILLHTQGLGGFAALWRQWDTNWLESIAVHGYVGPNMGPFDDYRYNVAFFPGLPLLMRLGLLVGIPAVATGLAVSLGASLIAAFGLARLVRDVGGSPALGALAWLIAPPALFLSAAYTEALFMAFALWAWVLARRGAWVGAGLLAGFAALVRPNGLFLGIGLIVMFLLARPRAWARGWALLVPFAVTAAYFAYLWAITGDWRAWSTAQEEFWGRSLVDPVTSFVNTYRLIFTFSPTGEPSTRMISEIIAMGILVVTVIVLAMRHWWPELAYTMATAISLGTSSMYYSVPRTLIVVFPLWMLVALWLGRARWRPWAYSVVCAPVLVLVTMRFVQAQWIS